MKLPHKTIERELFKKGYKHIVAVDEVGMGCLAGPVVVCAVLFTKKFYTRRHQNLHGLRDSKLLSSKKREEFARELSKSTWKPGFQVKICYSYPKTVDRLNIYQAARRAMRRAVLRCAKAPIAHSVVLVDGPSKIKGLNMEQVSIVKGDRKVFAIACASILAKVYRDRMMFRYAKKYPGYGFEKNKGYGTRYHRVQLASLGLTPIHRRSFEPVAKLL
mgnify:CR=1 FL=1